MSLNYMVSAFKSKVGNPLRKLILIKLADHANDNGECWPSYQHIADACETSRRSVITHISALEQAGYLHVVHRKKSEKLNHSNVYKLTFPSGESPAPPSESPAPGGSEGAAPRTIHSLESIKEPEKPKRSLITLSDYIKTREAENLPAINPDDPIFKFRESAGIPEKFMWLAWREFCEQFDKPDKKQKDWIAHFRNAVKRDWLKIWAINRDGEYYLTTRGKQAARIHLGETYHD